MTCLEDFSHKEKCYTSLATMPQITKPWRETSKIITTFEADYNLLGCTGHVFNLAAVAGFMTLLQ